jgi:PAS domain S-box-containing protein
MADPPTQPAASPSSATEGLFRVLVERNPDAVCVVDPDFTLRFANPAITQLLGWPIDQLIGTSVTAYLHPNDIAKGLELFGQILATPGSTGASALQIRGADGCFRECEGVAINLVGDPQVRGVMVVFRDATERRRVERAREESEERFQVLADHAPVMMWIDDANMQMIWENATTLEFTGRSLDQDLGMGWVDMIHPDDRSASVADYQRAFLARQPYAIEYRIRRTDGAWRRILDKGVPRWLASGAFAGYVGCFLDLTELREASERAQETEQRYDRMVAALQEGIVLQEADGRITACNASAERILGLSADQITGRTSLDPRWRAVRADGSPFPGEEHPAMVSLQTGQAQSDVIMGLCKPDGTLTWININCQPIVRPGEVKPSATVTSFSDITDRLLAEREVRASQERYRAFVEHSSEGVWRMEMTPPLPIDLPVAEQVQWILECSIIAECNLEFVRMYGYERPEEMIGKRLSEFMPAEDPTTREYIAAAVGNGYRMVDAESVEIARGGEKKNFLNNFVGIVEAGQLKRFWGTQRDITERKLMEEHFRQARKMETAGRLAGGIAHDFNNLLTAILGTAELLLHDLSADDSHRSDVEEIRRAANRAAGLTRQLLAFSRRQVLQPRILDLNAVVLGTEKMLQRVIGEDIRLVTHLAPDLGLVKADPGQVEQVILNLSVNARDAMPRGGELRIETRNHLFEGAQSGAEAIMPAGSYVLLLVTDTGTGMTGEIQRHLFEPFFTTKEPGKGTGLGLATVYGIVKQSGGFVFADSELDKGSSFRMYLPRVEGRPDPIEQLAPPLPLDAAAAQGSILLVEDEEMVRRLARRVLEGTGYAVLEAATGDEAIAIANRRDQRIDLIITDVIMPGMSGQELSAKLREQRPGIPVLYVSGYSEEAITQHGQLLPNTAFLQKPFSPAALVVKVREVLGAG